MLELLCDLSRIWHNSVYLSDTKAVFDKGGNQDVKRKLIACLLALLLCLSLCACGAMRGGTGIKGRDTTTSADTVPDTDDGFIEDGRADDGIVGDEDPASSPNVTRNP